MPFLAGVLLVLQLAVVLFAQRTEHSGMCSKGYPKSHFFILLTHPQRQQISWIKQGSKNVRVWYNARGTEMMIKDDAAQHGCSLSLEAHQGFDSTLIGNGVDKLDCELRALECGVIRQAPKKHSRSF